MRAMLNRKKNIAICSVILVLVMLLAVFVGCDDVFSVLTMNMNSKITIENGYINGSVEAEMLKANGKKRLATLSCQNGSKLELELKNLDVTNGKVSFYVADGDQEIKVISSETALGGDESVGFYEIRTDKKVKIIMVAEDFDGSFRLEIRGVEGLN